MHRHIRVFLFVLLILVLLPFVAPALPPSRAAPASMPLAVAGVPALPRSCIRAAPLDSFAKAVCCVNGYVYLNGVPIADAEVIITVGERRLDTRTQIGPDSSHPYFMVSLNATPLQARPGDTVTISARAAGQTKSVTFTAHEGGQQIDVVLPQSQVEAAWTLGEIPVQSWHAMVYDEARQRVVLFGERNDTWEWDGETWTQRTPATSPPARYAHALAYDAARQRVVLFGEYDNNNYLNDTTWEWDGETWTQRTPPTSPPVRWGHALAYDAARQRVVLFGGRDTNYNSLNDTWEWDGTTWTQRTPPTNPPAWYDHALAYDAARQRVVLFGGSGYNDTWEWDGETWTQRTPATSPPARYDHALAYDAARQRVVLFGGSGNGSLNDTWEWDGTTWTQRTPPTSPPARYHHALAYDAARQRVVLFGGSGNGSLNDTWEWDGTRWRLLASPTFTQPGTRTGAAFAYEVDGSTLLFGGRGSDNATYRWHGRGWRQVTPFDSSPAARSGHRLARNGDGSRLLLFGGLGANNTYLDDTWLWDRVNEDWLVQAPASKPTARAYYALTYDAQRNVWLLFGGQTGSAYLGDTWEYSGTTWTQRSPASSPPARSKATLTYDLARGRAVLIGGQNSSGYRDDVWEWDGSNWVNVTPTQRPGARSGHGAAFDTTRNVVVIAGGAGSSGLFSDTWEWNGSFWRQRATAADRDLPAMYNLTMAYDPVHDRLLVTGGENNSGVVEGLFLHQVTGTPLSAPPVATISRILPRDARQGVDHILFEGRGADADSTDVIVAYRWSLLTDAGPTVISTQATFRQPAAAFPLGPQTIRFEVQDDEGDWSPAIEQTIVIRDGGGGLASSASWTLLIYAAADNNLDPWMGDSAALNGMLHRLQQAGAQPNVQVGILYDGPTADDTRRYILTAEGTWTRTDLPEARMDDMETLRDFVQWGYRALPATDYYALSIVDHANGVVGIAQDETSKREDDPRPFLTPLQVRAALLAATDDGARKLDVLHYDGCSFGLFENAAIAADLAQFVIASPNTGWGVFAYDRYRALAGQAADPRQYALAVAQTYAELVARERLPYTIAVFDLAYFDALNAAISDLGQQLLTYVQAEPGTRREALRTLRGTMQKYDSGQGRYLEPDNEDSYVDLVHLAQQVRAEIPDAAVQAAAEAVLAQALPANQRFVAYNARESQAFTYLDPHQGGERVYNVQLEQAHGVGIFYPPRSTENKNSAYMNYVQHHLFHITRDSGWTRFLADGLLPQLGGDPPALTDDTLMPPIIPPKLVDDPGEPVPTVTPTPEGGVPVPTVTPTPEGGNPPTAIQRVFLPLVVR